MKFSVCIDMMFASVDFSERFSAVKKSGFDTVEFWKWSNKDISEVVDILQKLNMNLSVLNIDSTNEKLSYDLSRGILNAGRKDEFVEALYESIPYYRKLGATGLIVLVGETLNDISYEEQVENTYECLMAAKPIAEKEDITILVEPLNSFDRQNYALPFVKPVFELLDRVNSPHIKMLYDIYHQHMMGDFNLKEVQDKINRIGHFHLADCPGRHEPGTGKMDYMGLLRGIADTAYNGYVGLEYRATKNDEETFEFTRNI